MTAYYNEFDPFAAQWLRNLIDAGHIAPGVVDDRSITDVTASDLSGFTQCHFFAGIGGWSLALRLAGVPDSFPCWTGSPPCQPFSLAGKQLGQLDERHLAPTFMRLVAQCRPPVLFGEQVAAAISKHWLDDLCTELEAEGYACGSAVLPACSVGAPHKRDRLFFGASFVDHPSSIRQFSRWNRHNGEHDGEQSSTAGENGELADSLCEQRDGGRDLGERRGIEPSNVSHYGNVANSDRQQQRPDGRRGSGAHDVPAGRKQDTATATGLCCNSLMANTDDTRSQRRSGMPERADQQSIGASGVASGMDDPAVLSKFRFLAEHERVVRVRLPREQGSKGDRSADSHHGFWSDVDWLGCRDGKFRPVEPGTFPLANGISRGVGRGKSSSRALAGRNRVGRLRGYGNAIVPQVAAEFIRAMLQAASEVHNV